MENLVAISQGFGLAVACGLAAVLPLGVLAAATGMSMIDEEALCETSNVAAIHAARRDDVETTICGCVRGEIEWEGADVRPGCEVDCDHEGNAFGLPARMERDVRMAKRAACDELE